MVAEGGHEIAEKFNSPDAADRAEQENATKRKSASISIGEAKFEARGVDEPKQTKTRLFAADTRSLRPWPMVEEIKEVKVERREEEKRQSWQKGQNHEHSRPLFFPSPLRSLPSSSFSLPYRVCVVRYSTARYSATACAFDFSAYSRTCVEKHNVHRFFLCAAMYLRVYHFGIILFGSATARHTLASQPDNRPMSRSFSSFPGSRNFFFDQHKNDSRIRRSAPITNARPMFVSSNVRVNRTSLDTTRGYSFTLYAALLFLTGTICGLIASLIILSASGYH